MANPCNSVTAGRALNSLPATRARAREGALIDLAQLGSPYLGHNGGPPLREPQPVGRPTILTAAIKERIGDRLLEGAPLRAICRMPGMPSRTTIFKWRRLDPDFARFFEFYQMEGYFGLIEAVCAEVEEMLDRHGAKVARRVFNLRRRQLARMNPRFFGGP